MAAFLDGSASNAAIASSKLPVNTRFLVSLRVVDLGAFVNAAFGLGVLIYAAHKAGAHPSLMQIAGFGALCIVGICIHYSLMFLLATVWAVFRQNFPAYDPEAGRRPSGIGATWRSR